MANTTQTITSRFKTEGTGQVVKDTQRIGKEQTRLAQSSASAGRSFSAQASGLGGLVGIYAAAAANVFAISAAFTALNRAAQFGVIIQGTQQLADAVGSSATEVIGRLKEITDGQLSIVEAATQANLALSAGFNTEQIEDLGEVALKASRALGRNLTDSFQRITRGAIKLEPELLDEIGIFTRIEPAVEAYANSLNKSASQLTQFERRQAFVNQVIADGSLAFADIDDSGKSTQEVFESLVANFSDLAIIVGKFVADSLVPLAEFLDKNLGNRLILLGGIGALVFGKLKTVIGDFATTGLTLLSSKLEGVADRFANVNRQTEEFQKRQQQAAQSFVGQGAIAGPRGVGAQIKRDLQAGPLSTRRALEIEEQIGNRKKGLLADELQRRRQIREQIAAGTGNQEKLNRALTQSQARSKALLGTQRLIKDQLRQSGVAATILAKGLRGAGAAAGFLGKQLNRAFGIFNAVLIGFTTLQTILSFFDIDLFTEIKSVLAEINKEARQAAKGIEAIGEAARKSGEDTGLLAGFAKNIGAISTEVALEVAKIVAEIDRLGANSRRVAIARLRNELAALQSGKLGQLAQGFLFESSANERIAELSSALSVLDTSAEQAAIEVVESGKAVAELSEQLELGNEGLEKFGDLFESKVIEIKNGIIAISTAFGDLNLGPVDQLDESTASIVDNASSGVDKLNELQKALNDGSISASKASRNVSVVREELSRALEEAIKKTRDSQFGAAPQDLLETIIVLRKQLDFVANNTQETVNRFVDLDNLGKRLNKTFGGDFKLIDDQFISGRVSLESGKIARTSQEQATFQSQNLAVMLKQVDALKEMGAEQALIDAAEDNIVKLRKIAVAENLKLVQTTYQIAQSEFQRIQALQTQLDLIKAQNRANAALADNQLKNLQDQGALAELEGQKNLLQAQQNITEEVAKRSEIQRRNRMEEAQATARLQDSAADASLARTQRALDRANTRDQRALTALKAQVAQMERSNLTTEEDIVKNRIMILEKELEVNLAAIERQRTLLEAERTVEEGKIGRRKGLLDLEKENAKASADAKISAIDREKAIFEQEKAIIQAKLDADIVAQNRAIEDAKTRQILADTQAQADRDRAQRELDAIEERYKLLKAQILANKEYVQNQQAILIEQRKLAKVSDPANINNENFENATEAALRQIDSAIGNLGGSRTIIDQTRDERVAENQRVFDRARATAEERIKQLNAEKTRAQEIADQERKLFDERKKTVREELAGENAKIEAKIKAIDLELAAFLEAHEAKLAALDEDAQAAKADFEAKKAALEFQISAQAELISSLEAVRDVISEEIGSVVDKLFQNIADGKSILDSFGETLRNSFENIRKTILEKTLIEPIQKKFTSVFNDFFNGGGEKTVESTIVSANGGNAIRTIDAEGGANDPIKALTEGLKGEGGFFDQMKSQFMDLFGSFKTYIMDFGSQIMDIGSQLFSSLQGIGGSLFNGIGDIFSGIFSIFGFASGGLVKQMAAGGIVSEIPRFAGGGMMRDRVPALLEPGEFVMKRQSVDSIGAGNMAMMNATGKTNGNVVVNIKNEGTPQDAQASQPRFDGEKMVIDIVTRDLRNNGPIRKSLRGGAV